MYCVTVVSAFHAPLAMMDLAQAAKQDQNLLLRRFVWLSRLGAPVDFALDLLCVIGGVTYLCDRIWRS